MTESDEAATGRDRRLILHGLVGASAIALVGCRRAEEAEITPGEDLMQEHGVVERILLIYDDAAQRVEQNQAFDLSVITKAAAIVRHFVEDYHERTEEEFLFPRFEKAGREVALVTVLRRQHQRGREVTDELVKLAANGPSARLAEALRNFGRMYRPHAAREDTVLFPAFRAMNGRDAYRELGEQFEEREHSLVGEHGFEKAVAEVTALEKALGIEDLARFTA
jgi:hemerythrin-like domain-containing protein